LPRCVPVVGVGEGDGDGAGDGLGLGAGVGVGVAAGVGDGLAAGVGDGFGDGEGELAEAVFLVPPHPAARNKADASADKTRMLQAALRVMRMFPPGQTGD
jgi:hypothetical protein